jgi:hypothetical protein
MQKKADCISSANADYDFYGVASTLLDNSDYVHDLCG